MKTIRLSKELTLPVDVATQTILDIGKRGSGKSTTAARIVEQIAAAKIPFVVLDPADTWWGLKASRDGGPGLHVYVFGGRHADLPLEAGGGALVAEVLCEQRIPMVLSCKHLSGAARSRFMTDFATTLFQKWAGGALHVVLEEAHELAPQSIPKGEQAEAMLGAFKRLWKLGRSSGIGGTAITQRPAALHKDITTQSEILIVHRTIGPQDVEAVRQWIKYHGESDAILAELSGLATGEAFVWSPEFPEGDAIGLQRVQMLPRETFDSSATPKVGEERAEPKQLAAVDLERLASKMAATIERVKADDPRELRKALAEAKATIARLEKAKPAAPAAAPKATLKEAHVLQLVSDTNRLDKTATQLREQADRLSVHAKEITAALRAALSTDHKSEAVTAAAVPGRPAAAGRTVIPRATPAAAPKVPNASGRAGGKLGRRILAALSDAPDGLTRAQLGVRCVARADAGHFGNILSELRADGLITDGSGSAAVRVTQAGLDAAEWDLGTDIVAEWNRKLAGLEREILARLVEAYPSSLSRDRLGELTGKRSDAGHFGNCISTLVSNGIAVRVDREYVASKELFA